MSVKPESREAFLEALRADQQGALADEPQAVSYLFGEDTETPKELSSAPMVPRLDLGREAPRRTSARSLALGQHISENEILRTAVRGKRIPPQLTNRGGRPSSAPAPEYPLPPQPPPSPHLLGGHSGQEELVFGGVAPRRGSRAAAALKRSTSGGIPQPNRAGVYPTGALDSSFYRRPTFKARGACPPSDPVVGLGGFAAAEMYFNYAGDDRGGAHSSPQISRRGAGG